MMYNFILRSQIRLLRNILYLHHVYSKQTFQYVYKRIIRQLYIYLYLYFHFITCDLFL